MHLNIRVLCLYYFVLVFVSSTTLKPLNGTGHPNVSIVGGVPARAGEFPYLALIAKDLEAPSFCGGTLIGAYHVLTAAHCFTHAGTPVYLNTLSLFGGGRGFVNRTVKKFIKHEKFSLSFRRPNNTNDIAIIVLNSPVTTLPYARLPSQYSNSYSSYVNKSAVVAGWGITGISEDPPEILLKTNVTVWDNRNCSAAYPKGRNIFVGSLMMCANAPNKDTCKGDSGGPILVNGVQVGITSYGDGCGAPKLPGIYTRITALLKWIASTRAKYPK